MAPDSFQFLKDTIWEVLCLAATLFTLEFINILVVPPMRYAPLNLTQLDNYTPAAIEFHWWSASPTVALYVAGIVALLFAGVGSAVVTIRWLIRRHSRQMF